MHVLPSLDFFFERREGGRGGEGRGGWSGWIVFREEDVLLPVFSYQTSSVELIRFI